MDFELTEEQELIQEMTRRFLEERCTMGKVRQLLDDPTGFDRDDWREAAELGWTGILVPEKYGGGGSGETPIGDLVVIAEELGRALQPGPFLPTNVVTYAIAEFGSEEQAEKILTGLASGEQIGTWCFAEPGGRWDAEAIQLEARPQGDGFVLRGTKSFVQDAHVADHLLAAARTAGGLTQFLVPVGAAGITVKLMGSIDLGRRLAEVTFEDVEVSSSSVLGEVDGAADAIERQLQLALVLQCAETVGVTERTLEFTLEYANDRIAFGRPIGSYQALKHRFADMKMWLEASAGTATGATESVQAGAPDAAKLVSVAKAYIGDASVAIIQDCIQMHGGIGQTWENDIHLFLRRATLNAALFGSPAEHRERLCTLLDI